MKMIFLLLFILLFSHFSFAKEASPKSITQIKVNGSQSVLDSRFSFQIKLLKNLFEKAGRPELSKNLVMVPEINLIRSFEELKKGRLDIAILTSHNKHNQAEGIYPVFYPIRKGILGYRVFLVNSNNTNLLKTVNTLESLKKYSFGFSSTWADFGIYKHNRFKIIDFFNYDSSFKMLEKKRFQLFPRSVLEVSDELDVRKKSFDIAIDRHILLHYPVADMYYTNNKDLKDILDKGFKLMDRDGSWNELLKTYYSEELQNLKLKERKLIKISTPEKVITKENIEKLKPYILSFDQLIDIAK